jgi:hypothetical protein
MALDDVSALVLLPEADPSTVPAYVYYWGGGGRTEQLIRLMQRWHEEYGAEPVAVTGVLLTFFVARPPSDVRDARRVAAEQQTFIRPNWGIRETARHIVGYEWWELFDRP